jgi:UPF0755 protein
MKRFLASVVLLGVIAAALIGLLGWQFANNPLPLPLPSQTQAFEFTVDKGMSLKSLAKKLTERGLLPEPNGLWLLGRITNQATGIQAGTYRLDSPISPLALLKKMNDGDVVTIAITFVEGITFRQMRESMESNATLKNTLKGLSDKEVLQKIGATESHPEGLFFPDTYRFSAGATDMDILKISYQAMQKKLADAWAQREEGLPYQSPYEALIMASIIEKETGRADERALIGSVFINRLRIPMRLQTDPTVIYGMGQGFDGNIRRRDLTADTPYNTYTRDGLPPTPIAMPGWGSLLAAVRPEQSDKLYFVAKKDGQGSHYFSRTLDEHNRAVAKYQLGR